MEVMERFELAITILLVALVMICVYIAVSWTMWRKKKNKSRVEEWLDKSHEESSAFRKGFVPEGEEGLPKITITPVQPRPDISEGSAPVTDVDDEVESCYEPQDIDLGRLYFALQYDQQRSLLSVRLIRGEDIPMERDISATYVGVRLLPLRLVGEQIQPHETSINVSFQEVYEFYIVQSELAHQTLDFHICRYDRFSRKVAIGDVFLALAELSAQGIDLTKEVYLCRNLIHNRKAYFSDQENGSEGEQEAWKTKVSKSSPEQLRAKSMWKIVQAAVHQGKFRAFSQSLGGQETPFYWESMFSSEGENVESSPGKSGRRFYFSSGPGPPEEVKQQEEEEEEEDVDVEEVVRKGERSGSFLFPSQKSDEAEEVEVEAVEPEPVAPPTPLQISPAPEEYYRLVPFTPYTPSSPLKNQKQKDSNVSWHVPETFTMRGPDVVQALSDIYSDPRIITTAILRQNSGRRLPTQTTSTDSDRGRSATGNTGEYSHTKKRKKEPEERKIPSPPNGGRKVTRTIKRHKRKRSGGQKVKSKGTDQRSYSEPHTKHTEKQVFRIKPKKTRSSSSSSEEEQETKPTKKGQKQSYVKRKPEVQSSSQPTRESPLVFEAKDFSASCTYPLKDRAQSAPNILLKKSPRGERKRAKRPSVSMSNVRESHIDSSDVSSEFEQ